MGTRQLLKKFWQLLAPYQPMFYASIVCMVLAGATEPLLPWLLGELLDSGNPSVGVVPAQWLPWAFLAVIFARSVFGLGRGYLSGWLETTIQKDLRREAGYNVLHWPPDALMRSKSGDVTSHIVFLTGGLVSSFVRVVVTMVQDSVKIIGYLALLFYLNWKLALFVFAFFIPLLLVMRYLSRRIKKKSRDILSKTMASVTEVKRLIDSWKIIKTYAGQEIENSRLARIFQRMRNAMLRRVMAKSLLLPLNQLILAVPFAYIIYYFVAGLEQNTLTPGNVAAFLSTLLLINVPIRGMVSAVAIWVEMSVTAESVFKFLDSPTERDTGDKAIAATAGKIQFDRVSYRYAGSNGGTDDDEGGAAALQNISFTIAAGETIALVGRSGAGKTTLINLLPRFLSPTDGRILLDNADLNTLTLKSLRQHIDIVTQEPLLFDDTVANNISYPASNSQDSQRIQQALENAAAADFVNALPQGADTIIGAAGVGLSGGQCQRLVLARAFYRDAPVLIFDEATSALDSATEDKVKTALRRLLTNRTAIIIAHRFATIDIADRIAVLDEGNLIAIGTMQELQKTCPLFVELYNAQKLAE